MGRHQAEEMRSEISQVVTRLIDNVDTSTGKQLDLKHGFSDLVPASVYCSWVNAPVSDARFVADMSETVLMIFRRDPSLTPKIVAAYEELFDYARARLQEREAVPGDDFLSRLIECREAGELTADELEDFAVMLIEASTDNTSHQIAIAIDRLTSIPGLWESLANNPEHVTCCVREAMRMWPRLISTSRTALTDTTIANVEIPEGTSIFASFGACHRQGDVFSNPHTFTPEREKVPGHLNFGGGAFSCLGQFVASIEVEEAILQLASRFPQLKVVHAEPAYTPMFQSITRLDVELA